MAIIQAILALLSRSFGRIVSALFGWAVVALFGHTSGRQKLWLSVLVGAAAAWPVLLLGIAWPRGAALVLAFLPLPASVPDWSIRLAWIALAVSVPFALGVAVAARSRGTGTPIPGAPPAAAPSPLTESKGIRLLRGVPITLAVAASFLIVFVTVPAQRIASIIRRRVDVHVPLVTDAQGYRVVAAEIERTLDRHGFSVDIAEPPWWVTAPSRILLSLGGPSFREYVPERLAYFRGTQLEVILYPNGLLLRGPEQDTAWAHGVVVEALSDAPALPDLRPRGGRTSSGRSAVCGGCSARIPWRTRRRHGWRRAWRRSRETSGRCASDTTNGRSCTARRCSSAGRSAASGSSWKRPAGTKLRGSTPR
jgi:hypothetical protein